MSESENQPLSIESPAANIRERARELYQKDGECEIETGASVSKSEKGAYVQAWVWVPFDEAGQ